MKKLLLSILAIIVLSVSTVNAKELDLDSFTELEITHAYITGEIIFDVSGAFTPNLKDFMQASRTIPANEPTKLYDIVVIPKYNSKVFIDIYAGKMINTFPTLNCKKIFSDHIDNNIFKTVN